MLNGLDEINMLMTFVEILMDEKSTEKIKDVRLTGLKEFSGFLHYYTQKPYDSKLISAIVEKKTEMIKKATTKAEMEKIVKPRFPYYDGSKFVPDQYCIIEEEAIYWSEASLIAPLNHIALKRYTEIMKILYPDKAEFIEENEKL